MRGICIRAAFECPFGMSKRDFSVVENSSINISCRGFFSLDTVSCLNFKT